MKRRDFIKTTAALGIAAALPSFARNSGERPAASPDAGDGVPVAFLLSDGAVMIDFAGPWEVFQDVSLPGRKSGFRLYTVSEGTKPIRTSGGMHIVPDYSYRTAPQPKVIVIPAQDAENQATLDWIRAASKGADLTFSVCTGAFLLARTGLLSGKAATTNHNAYRTFAMDFADIDLKRGYRFVDAGKVATAGGLSSGIDLALHVVERYYGRETAQRTAFEMEYQGEGWQHADSNGVYLARKASTPEHPRCAVCEMEVEPTALQTVYAGKTYFFCMPSCKTRFENAPEKWIGE